MKKIFKNLVIIASFLFMLSLAVTPVLASNPFGFEYANELGLSNTTVQDPRTMATNIVQFFMTFLGIIAVVIILLGGFKWMTAAGNEDKVAEAKKLLVAGMIGLAIIIAAYVIVNFVITTTNSIITNGNVQY